MKTYSFLSVAVLFSLLFAFSCTTSPLTEIPDEVVGLSPVYAADGDWKDIRSDAPRSIQQLNKIYYKDSIIFVGEANQGVHIVDNRDPANPERIGFISLPGNSDIAIKGDVLYANNLTDLVAIDISNLNEVQVLSRVPDAFPNASQEVPINYIGFFECPDPELGSVIGWVETTLKKPQCWQE
jgi:hypothetical protein